ncbi:MAG: alpha/beta hydrolase [Gemmatimonadaceae bacterium]
MKEEETTHTLTGDIRSHERFRSRFLRTEHDILVYLPPGYKEDPRRRYPVLYLHDGQNVFDAATSFSGEWGVDETAQQLIRGGAIEPLIIVGISNGGEMRIDEYTPTRDRKRGAGGKAHLYGRMLVEEVKPLVDREYRTHPGPEHTGLGGSSLGGLVTLYLALKYSGIFWRLAVLSPSVWWDDRYIVGRIRLISTKPPSRIWLSVGTQEGPGVVEGARRLRDELRRKGWEIGSDLHYAEVPGAGHNEAAWAALVDPMLRHLFPPTR